MLIRKLAIFLLVPTLFLIKSISLYANTLDRVVAKVNSEIVTLSAVEERFKVIFEAIDSAEKIDSLTDKNKLMEKALNTIIEQKLQLQEAKKTGLTVDDKIISQALDDIKQKNNIDDQQLLFMLKNEGRSMESYRNVIRDQILVSRIARMNMQNGMLVSKKQIGRYYTQNHKKYWIAPKIKARHILFP